MNLTGRGIYQKKGKPKRDDLSRLYMQAVKQLPCVCCSIAPTDAHHVIHDRFGNEKASDWDVIPLCKAHHQDGREAIHNGKETWREKWGPDHSYVQPTRWLVERLVTNETWAKMAKRIAAEAEH
jgi:hypothetical protein